MKLKTAFLIQAIAIICSGCGGGNDNLPPSDNPEIDQVEFETVSCPARSPHSDIDEKFEAVVSDPHEFRELYLAIDPNNQDEVPTIDFDKRIAIILYMGRQTSSAPEVRMSRVLESEVLLTVEYQELKATSGCEGDTSIMYPYCIIAIDKTDKDIHFESQVSEECSTSE